MKKLSILNSPDGQIDIKEKITVKSIIEEDDEIVHIELEPEKEEKEEEIKELARFGAESLAYGIEDYIGSPDANLWAQMKTNLPHIGGHGNGGISCLGCFANGGSRGNPNYNFFRKWEFTTGGKIDFKSTANGVESCQIPPEGGIVFFEIKGNQATLTIKRESTVLQIYREVFSVNDEQRVSGTDSYYYFVRNLGKEIEVPFKHKNAVGNSFAFSISDEILDEIKKEKEKWEALGYLQKDDLTSDNERLVRHDIPKSWVENYSSDDIDKIVRYQIRRNNRDIKKLVDEFKKKKAKEEGKELEEAFLDDEIIKQEIKTAKADIKELDDKLNDEKNRKGWETEELLRKQKNEIEKWLAENGEQKIDKV